MPRYFINGVSQECRVFIETPVMIIICVILSTICKHCSLLFNFNFLKRDFFTWVDSSRSAAFHSPHSWRMGGWWYQWSRSWCRPCWFRAAPPGSCSNNPFRLEAALTDRDRGIRRVVQDCRASTISALHCRMMIMTILIVQGVSKKLVHFARRYI